MGRGVSGRVLGGGGTGVPETARDDSHASLALKIDALARNPRPGGTKKLVGEQNGWRLRVGDYRMLYEIRDSDRRILIVAIGHRREVYRRR